eukprot:1692956-Pyramimonas_sp.AAC.1
MCRANPEPTVEDVGKLRINWAGNTCVAWSPASTSKLKAFSHSSERVNNIWIVQKVRFAEIGEEDCFFQECS